MKRLIEEILSDLSGHPDAVTVHIPAFKIDLTAAEKAALLAFLEPYFEGAQKPDGGRFRVPGVFVGGAAAAARNRSAREWLNANGYAVGEKGRIPADMMEAFEAKRPNPDAARDTIRQAVKAVKAAPPVGQARKAVAANEDRIAQAVADAQPDNVEKTRGASTRKSPAKATVPPAVFSTAGATVTPIKAGRTGARSKNAADPGKVAAASVAATKAAPRRTTAKVAGS